MNASFSSLRFFLTQRLAVSKTVPPAAQVVRGEQRLRIHRGRPVSVDLAAGEACTVHLNSGTLWATITADPVDHVLGAGERKTFTGPGRLVLEALETNADFEVA